MATKQGRLEAKITVPTGGWSFTVSFDGLVGTSVRTIAAGAYWGTGLLDAFDAQVEAGAVALGGSITFTYATGWGESPTTPASGLIRLGDGGINDIFGVTWGSTDLRDLLGYTGNLSGAKEYTSTNQFGSVWLPHLTMAAPRNQDDGHYELDRTVMVSPRGHVSALGYESRRRLGRITWSHVQARYALESQESVTGESFERWWLDTHGGRESYYGRAPLCRLYWDADEATCVEFRLIEPLNVWNPDRPVPEWIGVQTVTIDGYKVPS